jgi:formamidopyrimidine-DNA glycosylase
MNQLRKFMYGRYGFDQLSRALVITSLLISLITTFTRSNVLVLIGYIPLAYAIFRILSKDIQKRTQENIKYCQFAGSLRNSLNQFKLSLFGSKTHKYYKCVKCKQTIRVPRGKGKICIACPKCKTEFVRKT